MYSIGADLGGTKVSAVLVDPSGAVLRSSYLAHDGTADGAIDAIVAIVAAFAAAAPADVHLGVAAAGLVDRTTGDLIDSALLGAKSVALGDRLASRLQLDVLVENDANATLRGVLPIEAPTQTALLVALGTGVGGAASFDGTVVEGANGFAAEIGHIPVEQSGIHPCPCGSSGCLELFASGPSVALAAEVRGLRAADGSAPRAEDVVIAAAQGDPTSLEVLDAAGSAIGHALVALIAVVDPAVIYISGGFGHAAAPFLIPAVVRRIAAQQSFSAARRPPEILVDPVGPLAAAIGAARLAHIHHARESTVHERCSNEP
ncbi:MAG: ROK family protein [Mycetocola sp.]